MGSFASSAAPGLTRLPISVPISISSSCSRLRLPSKNHTTSRMLTIPCSPFHFLSSSSSPLPSSLPRTTAAPPPPSYSPPRLFCTSSSSILSKHLHYSPSLSNSNSNPSPEIQQEEELDQEEEEQQQEEEAGEGEAESSAALDKEDVKEDVSFKKQQQLQMSVKERKELASYAHSLGKKLKSQQVGKSGVTPAVANSFLETLESKELLKLKIHGSCPGELSDVIKQLEEVTGSVAVDRIGRTVILYRPSLSKMKKREAASLRKPPREYSTFRKQKKVLEPKSPGEGHHQLRRS